jgi:hypothetical protein
MIEKHEFDWRTEAGLIARTRYKKHFAFLPVTCVDNSVTWLKPYYKKYTVWLDPTPTGLEYDSKKYIETVTESEFIIRKLSDTL